MEAIERQMDALPALVAAGRVAVALPHARNLVREARTVDYPSVLAEALEWNGRLELDFGEREAGLSLLYEAYRAANEARDDARASAVARWLLYYGASLLEQDDQVDLLWKMADSAMARVETQPYLVARRLDTKGLVLWRRGKHAEGAGHAPRPIDRQESLAGSDEYEMASMLSDLSVFLADERQVEKATEACRQALAALETSPGEVASKTAMERQNRDLLQFETGDHSAATTTSSRSASGRPRSERRYLGRTIRCSPR